MDKNERLVPLFGAGIDRIGDWTPQQLSDFIINISNDPTATPHAFRAKTVHVDEVVLRGQRLHLGVAPGALIMGDRKGSPTNVHARHTGTAVLNRAYAPLDSTSKYIFAETFDMHDADRSGGVSLVSGTGRATAIYVPTRERLSHLEINYTQFEAGGAFTYGGWALYGPVQWTAGAINLTAIPQVAITETNTVTNFRATGSHFVSGGLHAYPIGGSGTVLEPGIYFVVGLYVFSVAPATNANFLADNTTALPGVADMAGAVPAFFDSATKAGLTVLPTSLDITSWTLSNARIWAALYDDRLGQI